MPYYFKFRQTRPAGHWVVTGPYKNRDEAMKARARSKAWDCEVGIPFPAENQAEAEAAPDI